MNKILESLDEAIFTPELKSMIQEMFEGSIATVKEGYETQLVEAEQKIEEAQKALEVIAEEHEVKLQAVTKDLKEASEDFAIHIKEEMAKDANAFADTIKADYEAKANAYGELISENYKNKFVDTMDLFLSRVVEEYLEENRLVAESTIQEAKVSALLEGFDSLLSAGSVQLQAIGEEEKVDVVSEEIAELKESVSKLLKDNSSLKKENGRLIKEGIIAEMTEDMSAVEKDKFDRLAKVVSFNEADMGIYTQSLKSIKESVIGSVEEEEEEETLTESAQVGKPSWMRFA